MHILGIMYAIIPYCYPFKGKTQRRTSLGRGSQTPSVVLSVVETSPHRWIVEDNIPVGIIQGDRFFGDIRGIWPSPEKVEALSRRILNPESRKAVGT